MVRYSRGELWNASRWAAARSSAVAAGMWWRLIVGVGGGVVYSCGRVGV
jgi:hypothetical protein